jgi:toxin-antitoxin system PIN domain toxin
VIAVETNILVYSHRPDSPHFSLASSRIRALAESSSAWAIPWPCLHEFVAVVTNHRIYKPPSSMLEALKQVYAWMQSPSLVLLTESTHHWSFLKDLAAGGRISGGQIHDARIAALCLEHGVRELWSADRDFNRFKGLKVVNPLVG